jgi:hypothetical protein
VLAIALSIFLGLVQASQTGTVVGVVKLPNQTKPAQAARVVLLPPNYTEVWNKQVQQRLDNYWEIFKPEFYANKDHFADFDRVAHVEAFQYVTSTMRRELGDDASKLIKDASPAGQFEFRGIPLGTYQVIVRATFNGQDVVWSRTLEVQMDIPVFVDLGKPVS